MLSAFDFINHSNPIMIEYVMDLVKNLSVMIEAILHHFEDMDAKQST